MSSSLSQLLEYGYSRIPKGLWEHRRALDLDNAEIELIGVLLGYQYDPDGNLPFPSNAALATTLGWTIRTVQRWKSSLARKGYLAVFDRYQTGGGQTSCAYDLSALWEKVRALTEGTRNSQKSKEIKAVRRHPPMSAVTSPPCQQRHPGDVSGVTPGMTLVSPEEEELNKKNKKKKNRKNASGAAHRSFSASLATLASLARPSASPSGINEGLEIEDRKIGKVQAQREISAAFEGSNRPVKVAFPIDPADVERWLMAADDTGDRATRARAIAQAAAKRTVEQRVKKEQRREARGYKPKVGPIIAALAKRWADDMEDAFPDLKFARWEEGGKEVGQVKKLVEKYGGDTTALAFKYLIKNWEPIKNRFLKGKGTVPTLGFLLKFHDALYPEAQKWGKVRAAVEAYDEWFKKNPDAMFAPAAIEQEYAEAKKVLKELGLC